MIRIGHKGADAIVPGNTIESFRRAVELGVDVIELDVLPHGGEFICAHDPHEVESRECLDIDSVVRAFTEPPLDGVRVNFDMKHPGAEEHLVEALRRDGMVDRAMTSGAHLRTIRRLGELEPALSRGWTVPRVRRDWTSVPWARPLLPLALLNGRRRLPAAAREWISKLGVDRMWVFHRLISRRLVETAHELDTEVFAWTVDDLAEMRALAALDVDGICSNDPRLFARL